MTPFWLIIWSLCSSRIFTKQIHISLIVVLAGWDSIVVIHPFARVISTKACWQRDQHAPTIKTPNMILGSFSATTHSSIQHHLTRDRSSMTPSHARVAAALLTPESWSHLIDWVWKRRARFWLGYIQHHKRTNESEMSKRQVANESMQICKMRWNISIRIALSPCANYANYATHNVCKILFNCPAKKRVSKAFSSALPQHTRTHVEERRCFDPLSRHDLWVRCVWCASRMYNDLARVGWTCSQCWLPTTSVDVIAERCCVIKNSAFE